MYTEAHWLKNVAVSTNNIAAIQLHWLFHLSHFQAKAPANNDFFLFFPQVCSGNQFDGKPRERKCCGVGCPKLFWLKQKSIFTKNQSLFIKNKSLFIKNKSLFIKNQSLFIKNHNTSASACFCILSFSSISLSSSCILSMEALRGPQRRVYSTMAMVYCTSVAQSSLEYLAAAIEIPPMRPWGEADLLTAMNCFSGKMGMKHSEEMAEHSAMNSANPVSHS